MDLREFHSECCCAINEEIRSIIRELRPKHHESEQRWVFEVPPLMQYNLKHESSLDGNSELW